MSNKFDVVVIGGGPVGLWLACELALAKVKVIVLERRTERVTQSRALTLHGRTLEVFALRGIAERFLSLGRSNPGFFFGGLDTLLDFSALDSRFPFTLFLPQATTERLIEERALELGVDIRRGHSVDKVEQDADGVVDTGPERRNAIQLYCALRRRSRWRSQYRKACLGHRFCRSSGATYHDLGGRCA